MTQVTKQYVDNYVTSKSPERVAQFIGRALVAAQAKQSKSTFVKPRSWNDVYTSQAQADRDEAEMNRIVQEAEIAAESAAYACKMNRDRLCA